MTRRLGLALALFAMGGSAGAAASARLRASDRKFVLEAAQASLLEVQLGDLIALEAIDADVEAFGRRLVVDHGRINQELRTLAAGKGVSLPTALDERSKAMLGKLEKMKGIAFDRAAMSATVKNQELELREFAHQAKVAHDPDVRHFAEAQLPTLHDRLRVAKDIDMRITTGTGGTGQPEPLIEVPVPAPPAE